MPIIGTQLTITLTRLHKSTCFGPYYQFRIPPVYSSTALGEKGVEHKNNLLEMTLFSLALVNLSTG
jgi:hypothetical protein